MIKQAKKENSENKVKYSKDKNVKLKKKNLEESEDNLKQKDNFHIIDFIISPLKQDYEFELWTIKEIAIFESAICIFGKRFNIIDSMIPSKSLEDIIYFYASWKYTSHYAICKKNTKRLEQKCGLIWH